eukprot:3933333-Rhodomonas_salina.1
MGTSALPPYATATPHPVLTSRMPMQREPRIQVAPPVRQRFRIGELSAYAAARRLPGTQY